MTLVRLIATAWCQQCDWTAEGDDQALVDRAADKHCAPGHPTECSSRPEVKA